MEETSMFNHRSIAPVLFTLTTAFAPLLGGGCSSDSAERSYFVLVRGELRAATADAARSQHDATESSLRAAAEGAGNLSHAAFLDIKNGSQPALGYLAAERWSGAASAASFYHGQAGAQLGAMFASTPAVTTWEQQDTWVGWGGDDAIDASPGHFIIIARGKLKTDAASAHAAHDQFFGPVGQALGPAGYQRHHAFIDANDPTNAMFIGVWTNVENFLAAASDPSFQQFLGGFFEGGPDLSIWATTDWQQW
jgi:quinol monooxygenase YgiN